ncbi:MAG: cellulase [Burkholderiales bacterium]|nr:cellulase [Opitutaceae bacterium]
MPTAAPASPLARLTQPLAITMWDFSWLERRWPGAGYEDWDLALDELAERGYNAVRIDAYPHLLDAGPEREWDLDVLWTVQDWGSPAPTRVRVWPALPEFMRACAARGIRVALSTWFRKDTSDTRMNIRTAADMARIWIRTLELLQREGLTDDLLYVDLCNEWPGTHWAPFFVNEPPELTWGGWHSERSLSFMRESIALVRAAFPRVPLTYSFNPENPQAATRDLGFLDFFEPHIWMVNAHGYSFNPKVGYGFELTDPKGYYNIQKNAERVYREDAAHWNAGLVGLVHAYADVSRAHRRPLITTECWGIVDYKDWPLLDWGWVKETCELGTLTAAATGRWAAIATSNFCGPQFRGMWRDIAWHQRMTAAIKGAALPQDSVPCAF